MKHRLVTLIPLCRRERGAGFPQPVETGKNYGARPEVREGWPYNQPLEALRAVPDAPLWVFELGTGAGPSKGVQAPAPVHAHGVMQFRPAPRPCAPHRRSG